ncbi:hypothetical protein HCJ70_16170 [Listeria booriae]|uniref:DUF6414 family protein n=1 Tax=Listeria booriae TaxID=1552123 RepID=UPI0016237B87|nr:hypothetical protein [Listeria booriae]MBC2100588.1 hypothetical protein [Listeria booriae]
MKEIIYLDTEQMNSIISQLDNGLTTQFGGETSNQKQTGHSATTGSKVGTGVEGDIKLGAGALIAKLSTSIAANLVTESGESETSHLELLDGQKDIMNKIFHDKSLDILLALLTENDLLKSKYESDGDFIMFEEVVRILDFNFISQVFNFDNFMSVVDLGDKPDITKEDTATMNRLVKKQESNQPLSKKEVAIFDKNKEAYTEVLAYENLKETMRIPSEGVAILDKFLPKSILIKTNNLFAIGQSKYLRDSSEVTLFRNDNGRTASILARVVSKKNIIDLGGNMAGEFSTKNLDAIPLKLIEITFGNMGMLTNGDIIAIPIAIYYE